MICLTKKYLTEFKLITGFTHAQNQKKIIVENE